MATKTVSNYLSEQRILFFPAGPSKRQVIGSLIAALDLKDPTAAIKAILAREEQGSTIIAPGLALPHARIDGIKHIEASIGICPSGVHDLHGGGQPIRVYVLFLGPIDNMKEHLAFLANVSALFQKKGFIDKLCKLASPQGILLAIRQAEKSS
jgi:mannitol/fructose-specific phosphotransferase system IIA component (Ntr-type)